MNYQTYRPHPDLQSIIQCYWTLEVDADKNAEKQRIVPDGCIEMAFILGDDIKRYTSDDNFILQPRAMVLGQTIDAFYIQPTGYVNTFAVRFYPLGFANLVSTNIKTLANRETELSQLFGEEVSQTLTNNITKAIDTIERIQIIEEFLFATLRTTNVVDKIVQSTVDALLSTNGSVSIKDILNDDLSKRRQLERKFTKQIGISPKQLGKVIRMQSALKLLISQKADSLTQVAYSSDYYDQAHFIKDFKEFTGTNPKEFLAHENLKLSALFYSTEDS